MKLSIVIPAYNEQDAIASTVDRTLIARETITRCSPVTEVEIIVVSDGSTDRTAEIARRFAQVQVIAFEHNRGYGAAIKAGFERATGDLLGFLDADGTCDPAFFATLCQAVIDDRADVAIGSRMGPDSHMPRVRRLGNRTYAFILSVLSNRVVTDTASGMRVIRREVLPRLYPLPDGMHFTPAMSARVLMDDSLRIVERPMSYEERIGESKLNVIRDGVRFFRTILEMTLMWRPAKLFLTAATMCLATMLLFAMHPIEMWLTVRRLEEDMIYRLLFCSLLGAFGTTLLSAGVVSEHVHRLLDRRPNPNTFTWSMMDALYSFHGLGFATAAIVPIVVWLMGHGVWTRLTEGFVAEHWSRAVLAGLLGYVLVELGLTTLVVNLLRFHTARSIMKAAPEVSRSLPAAGLELPSRPAAHPPSHEPLAV